MNLSFLTLHYVQLHLLPGVNKVSKDFVYHFKAQGARNVTFRNFHIDDLQISVAHCACPSDYVAHKILPSNKT